LLRPPSLTCHQWNQTHKKGTKRAIIYGKKK
jgi:hypothetical protein